MAHYYLVDRFCLDHPERECGRGRLVRLLSMLDLIWAEYLLEELTLILLHVLRSTM